MTFYYMPFARSQVLLWKFLDQNSCNRLYIVFNIAVSFQWDFHVGLLKLATMNDIEIRAISLSYISVLSHHIIYGNVCC